MRAAEERLRGLLGVGERLFAVHHARDLAGQGALRFAPFGLVDHRLLLLPRSPPGSAR